jgi:2-(1,2-epoxy-1,2-dihydrophenyl)acetyl-CoA isomerase
MIAADVIVSTDGGDHVGIVSINRPPDNYFDVSLIASIADAYDALGREPQCRAIILRSEGKHFCAGAAFGRQQVEAPGALYSEAIRLFAARLPVVAAVQGAAIGGGLGLALSADFRVAAPESRWSANFARLGFHHGFGLTVTLPAVVGQQQAMRMLLTGARLAGDEAHRIGLVDQLVGLDGLDAAARQLAAEVAASGPLAIDSIRQTMRAGLVERIRAATEREQTEQDRLMHTTDFAEGIRAMSERRRPHFEGR